MQTSVTWSLKMLAVCGIVFGGVLGGMTRGADRTSRDSVAPSEQAVADQVDRIILKALKAEGTQPSTLTNDEDFLRRVSLDLAGKAPSPAEVTLFGLDPDSQKRSKTIDRLLDTDAYAENWARYWRDAIFSRATEMRARIAQPTFERWMTARLTANAGWDEITTDLLTATGDVRENGETALMMAQGGEATDIAAEVSRLFLGVQIQCANCHDHPTDQWKRNQFHELAAFFPRVRVRPVRDADRRSFEVVSFNFSGDRDRGAMLRQNPEFIIRRLDRNRDNKLSKNEVTGSPLERVFDRLLQVGDANNDKALSAVEFKALPEPPDRGTSEYFMPDLSDPSSEGTRIDPVFFVGDLKPKTGLSDLDRRGTLAEYITSPNNPWFAKAFVNRIWAELTGFGFYMPIDDIGPERSALLPEVLDILADGFISNNFDVKWLLRTITNTETYQRRIRAKNAGDFSLPFAAATPMRLRADQVYNTLTQVLGVSETGATARGQMGGMEYRGPRSPRDQFNELFGFDPSTPQEEITSNVPQALALMNSPTINQLVSSTRDTRLSRLLKQFDNDDDALTEMYLLVFARQPSEKELEICRQYIRKVNNRGEAFEDIMWSLINSSEFLSKR